MNETLALEIALLLALLVLWLVVVRSAWRAWQPARLLLLGRYADARIAAESLGRSWMRVFPGVRRSARYAIGAALHLEGELEASIAALAPLHEERLRGNMRYAICSIEAANLVLLDRDHARASTLLEEAARVHRPPEDMLLTAHAKHGLGDPDAAARLFAAVGRDRTVLGRAGGDRAEDRRQKEAIFHTLRGLYLMKIGRATEAQRDFEIAARSPFTNVYVERARTMLEAQAAATEGDGPSSLAPQIVTKEIAKGSGED